MIIQFIEVKNLFDNFNNLIARAENIVIFTRDKTLQKEEIKNIKKFILKAEKLKTENKSNYSEQELNFILCLIISADTIALELSMIIHLKENKMDFAWSSLVQAQNQILLVVSNHPFSNGEYLKGYIEKLDAYEKFLFPKMIFASTGGIIKKTRCSICAKEYEECDHLKGKMYKGELYVREIHEIELEEVSLVENPANKLCRQLQVEYKGKMVDTLTLK